MKYYIALFLLIGLGCKGKPRIEKYVKGEHFVPTLLSIKGKRWLLPGGEYNLADSINQLAMGRAFSGEGGTLVMVNIKGDTFSIKEDTVYDMPLYVVNGRVVPRDSALKIPPSMITSIKTVLDEKDVQKYGDKAKKGVIYIMTKGNAAIFNIKTANYPATKDSLPWSNDTTFRPIPSGPAYFSAKDVGHLIKIKKQKKKVNAIDSSDMTDTLVGNFYY